MKPQHPYNGIATGPLKPIAAVLSIVALLTGCSVEAKDSKTEIASTDKVVSVNITEPSNGLLPSDTSDMSGWKIVSQLYDGLVTFDASGNETFVEAESITPNDDASEYTIVIKPDLTFSNGEKITAKTYARSWSFAANAANGQVGASIFEDIQGYDELQDEKGSKTAQLSGLDVVDDTTLKVTLKAPNSAFLYKIGDIAFLPMPSEVIKNPKEYGQKPIGNGPYKLKAYKSGEEIILERDDSYAGPRKTSNAGIDFKVYQSLDAAYSDLLAGNLDVLDSIPTSALKTYRNETSITAVSKPGPAFSAFTIAQNLKHFQGEEGKYRRQAIAHAINREDIAKAIFGGTVTPATDFLAPVIKGYDTDLDTDGVLSYDKAKSKELWAKADAISPWDGTFRIAYSADGTDREWVEAAANSIRNTLGINAESYPFATSKELRSAIQERTVNAAFKSGMQSDYPHPEGYLVQAYDSSAADGKGLNNGDYKSDRFDALIDQAAAETDLDKAVSLYRQSERVLLDDLPVIPLWYTNVTAAAVKGVQVDYNYMGVPEYNTIVK
ncbi:peptide ABC transporter substrate-binding protein [Bifidobacterium moukalabense]|uniref:peptide ABC transporter substrate-binding protein n=1 Tax=Bifidobacterium moukalabense TaxID=1333651 RepID=UPI0010F83074|nr:ABC transporter substrate-binding protein [Bifidobacterium moukalabense]